MKESQIYELKFINMIFRIRIFNIYYNQSVNGLKWSPVCSMNYFVFNGSQISTTIILILFIKAVFFLASIQNELFTCITLIDFQKVHKILTVYLKYIFQREINAPINKATVPVAATRSKILCPTLLYKWIIIAVFLGRTVDVQKGFIYVTIRTKQII